MMRFAAAFAVGAVLAAAGCQNNNAQPEPTPEPQYSHSAAPERSLSSMDAAADTYYYEPGPETEARDTWQPAQTYQPADEVLTPAGAGRTHVVRRGDTLIQLARQYYNDQARWKQIWEANKTRVPDPNQLEVGTRLIIP